MSEWQDATSYSRSDTERIPNAWRMDLAGLHLVVHRLHGVPDVWYLTCEGFFYRKTLDAKDVDEAKKEAVTRLAKKLQASLHATMTVMA